MLRSLYTLVLRAHPSPFRQRFGEEMLDIFEQAGGVGEAAWLVGEGVVSVWRQWVLRPEFRRRAGAAALPAHGPMFASIANDGPDAGALLQGALAAALVFAFLALVTQRGIVGREFAIQAAGFAARSGRSTAVRDVGAEGRVKADLSARQFSASARIWRVLDADGDLALSPWEIVTAPAALRRLDGNHDGRLSAGECGRRDSLFGVLDADRDGSISAEEIARSALSLRQLDSNQDGYLLAEELP